MAGEIRPRSGKGSMNGACLPKYTSMTGFPSISLLLCLLAFSAWPVAAQVLRVGPDRALRAPSQAANIARDNDLVEIDAGAYQGDVAVWRANGLTLRGVNGMAHLFAAGEAAEGKGLWVIRGNDTTVENIGFHDTRVRDRNGAGIRLDGRGLTVRGCLFQNNENGILAGTNAASEILVERSEFTGNGHGDGYSHNIYIGAVAKFTLRDSVSHLAVVGHQVKSRARENLIVGNRIADEESGRSSYLIDLPNGGIAEIRDNTLQQGALAENGTMVAYGAEKLPYPENRLLLEDNTFINDRPTGCRLLFMRPGSEPAVERNNRILGCGKQAARARKDGDAMPDRPGNRPNDQPLSGTP